MPINNPPLPAAPIAIVPLMQETPATGSMTWAGALNDNNPANPSKASVLAQEATVVLPYPMLITQWRNYGDIRNNGNGFFQIRVFNTLTGAWETWCNAFTTNPLASWSSWASQAKVLVQKIRLIAVDALDTGDGSSYIGELEVKY